MYVGLGTQPPVCDNRTCHRYVPSLFERKAGSPPAAEPEPLEDAPELDWTGLPIDWTVTPLFLSDAPDPRDVIRLRDALKARALEVLREYADVGEPEIEVKVRNGRMIDMTVTYPGITPPFDFKLTP